MAREHIQKKLEKVFADLEIVETTALGQPAELSRGDYSSNVALQVAKKMQMSPRACAEKIVTAIGDIEGIEKIEIAGAGFINFFLSRSAILHELTEAQKEAWGTNTSKKAVQEMYEYTDPNPFKAFHIGHLMSNTIGESLSRLAENAGVDVVRANYQGDLGVHVASAIWGMQKLGISPESADEFGRAYAEGATAYKENETAKSEIDALNKKLYDRSDNELNELYDAGRAKSLEAFENIYRILGTTFNRYYFESETGQIGKEIVLQNPTVFPESEGARVFRGEDYGLHTRVFINKQGLPTYEAKELGLEKKKSDEYPQAAVFAIVTANEITEYFKVLKKAMEQVFPHIAAKLHHVPHGMMKLQSGKMSSRTGTVITGESLLGELQEAAHARSSESRAENPEELSRQVAVAAIKYQILRQGVGKDIIFERERALSLEGDSGPYIQYAYTRAVSLLQKGHEASIAPRLEESMPLPDFVRHLIHFPEVTERAYNEYEPHHVTTFITEIASAFNTWYAQEKIIGTEESAHKLAIVDAVRQTLKRGLWLLGIPAPEKM